MFVVCYIILSALQYFSVHYIRWSSLPAFSIDLTHKYPVRCVTFDQWPVCNLNSFPWGYIDCGIRYRSKRGKTVCDLLIIMHLLCKYMPTVTLFVAIKVSLDCWYCKASSCPTFCNVIESSVEAPDHADLGTYCNMKVFFFSLTALHMKPLTAPVQISHHASLKPEGRCQMAPQCLHIGQHPDSLAAPICAWIQESRENTAVISPELQQL